MSNTNTIGQRSVFSYGSSYGEQMSKWNSSRINLMANGNYSGAGYYAAKIISTFRMTRVINDAHTNANTVKAIAAAPITKGKRPARNASKVTRKYSTKAKA